MLITCHHQVKNIIINYYIVHNVAGVSPFLIVPTNGHLMLSTFRAVTSYVEAQVVRSCYVKCYSNHDNRIKDWIVHKRIEKSLALLQSLH